MPPLKPPTIWTSAALKELKAKLRTEKDSVVTVYRGDIMTVHVPTIPEAKKVCWEFATDGYDIGFGIYFDWTPVTTRSITVHISESSDDEDEEEGIEGQFVFSNQNWGFFNLVSGCLCRSMYFCICSSAQLWFNRKHCVGFMWFIFQVLSVMAILRRAPKLWPTQTWLKSYLCTARTVTCPSSGVATISQVKALTSWSLTTLTHCGEIKRFTTEFITVPKVPVPWLWMYNLHNILLLRTLNYF